MISIFWTFIGFLTGLLIISVFNPADRKTLNVPSPQDTDAHETGTGCVKFKTEEVPCDGHETSLNVIASKNK